MATKTAYRSRSQGNYITPNTAEGKKILNYLRNRCEKAWLFRTYCAKMLIEVSEKGLKEISYEKVNDKYTKFTGGHSRK